MHHGGIWRGSLLTSRWADFVTATKGARVPTGDGWGAGQQKIALCGLAAHSFPPTRPRLTLRAPFVARAVRPVLLCTVASGEAGRQATCWLTAQRVEAAMSDWHTEQAERRAVQTTRGAREASRLRARGQRRSAQGQSERDEPRTYRKTRDSPGRHPRREAPAEWRADAGQIAAHVGCMAAVLRPSERSAASAGGEPQGAAGPRSSVASSLWPCSRKGTRQGPTWAAPSPSLGTRR